MAKEQEKRSVRGEGQSKRKTMLLPVTAGHSEKIREQRCEPAYVHADHEKRTDATHETNRWCTSTDFPVAEYPPSDPADFKISGGRIESKKNNNSYE